MPEQRPHPQALADGAHTHPGVLHPIPVGSGKRQRERRKAGRRWAYSRRIQGEREGAGNLARGGDFSHPPGTSILEPGFGWGWGRLEGTGVRWRLALFSAPGGSPGLWPGAGEQSWPSPDS